MCWSIHPPLFREKRGEGERERDEGAPMQSHRIAPNNHPSKLGGATTIPRLTQMLTCRSYMDTNFGVAVSQLDALGIVMKIPTSSSSYPSPSHGRAWSSSDPTMAKNGLVLSSPSTPSTRPLSLVLPLLPCPYLHTTTIAFRAKWKEVGSGGGELHQ